MQNPPLPDRLPLSFSAQQVSFPRDHFNNRQRRAAQLMLELLASTPIRSASKCSAQHQSPTLLQLNGNALSVRTSQYCSETAAVVCKGSIIHTFNGSFTHSAPSLHDPPVTGELELITGKNRVFLGLRSAAFMAWCAARCAAYGKLQSGSFHSFTQQLPSRHCCEVP